MNTIQTTFTIHEVAAMTGLTEHTLRYYERIGVLMPIDRAGNGHRRYSQRDIDVIQLMNRLRQTGMSLEAIQHYVALLQENSATVDQRRAMLETHRQTVASQMARLQAMLDFIDDKLENCPTIGRKTKIRTGT